jgi:hypothetical protein
MLSRKYKERIIESWLFSVSTLTVVIVFLICLFLFSGSLLLFKSISLPDFLTGKFWYPTSANKQFGLLSLFFGSLLVTAGTSQNPTSSVRNCSGFVGDRAGPGYYSGLNPQVLQAKVEDLATWERGGS